MINVTIELTSSEEIIELENHFLLVKTKSVTMIKQFGLIHKFSEIRDFDSNYEKILNCVCFIIWVVHRTEALFLHPFKVTNRKISLVNINLVSCKFSKTYLNISKEVPCDYFPWPIWERKYLHNPKFNNTCLKNPELYGCQKKHG